MIKAIRKISNMREALKKADLKAMAVSILKNYPEEIEDKQTEMLYSGLDGSGAAISPEYRPFTVEVKKAKGQPYDRVTLKDEGDFYKKIRAEIDDAGVRLRGDDQKTIMLMDKYGDEILKLSGKTIEEIKEEILLPELRIETLKRLKNG